MNKMDSINTDMRDSMSSGSGPIKVRLATTPEEIREAQKVRYKVFYEEYGAHPSNDMLQEKRDFDCFDEIADHLIVFQGEGNIVGTYRLMRHDIIHKIGRYYSSDEYDLTALISSGGKLLELGRSCVLAPFRTRPVLQMLWNGIADYITRHQIDTMFGCASLPGTNVDELSDQLSYLYHYHLADDSICTRALENRFIDMNRKQKNDINVKAVFANLPPLIKGYLRVGAMIGNGAVIDSQFNTVDVCIILPTQKLAQRYVRHYAARETGVGESYGQLEPALEPALGGAL